MITLRYNSNDPYSRYGAEHFIQRSGIPFVKGEGCIQYGVMGSGEKTGDVFSVKIHGNDIQNKICGQISFNNNSATICEIPVNTGDGKKVIAYFMENGNKYPCVTENADGIYVGIDIFQETGFLLSGHLDRIWGELDDNERTLVASHPAIDFLEDLLTATVIEGCRTLQIPLVRKSSWPDAKKFAVCLTHDVDEVRKTYQWVTRPVKCIRKGDLGGLKNQMLSFFLKIKGNEPYWTFNDIAAIEKHFNAKSTFFFLKESGKSSLFSPRTWNLYGRCHSYQEPGVVDAIRVASEYGSEVAVHGSFYSYSTPGLLHSETNELESMIQEKVVGTRQHHLNLSVPVTWDYQWEAGLIYDTSLGYKDRIGFRWGTSYPFFPFTGTISHRILEIPLIIMDICLLSSKDPLAECLAIADEVERVQGVLTLLWHPPVFNALEFPGAGDIYYKIIERSVGQNAWVTSAKDIAAWQQDRDNLNVALGKKGSAFTITLSPIERDSFLSIQLPPQSAVKFSENATVIRKDIDPVQNTMCIDISVKPMENNNEIVVNF